jgi:hypothetical protein
MKHCLLFVCLLVLAARPAQCSLLLDEPFDYPDGPLAAASSGRWLTHGGVSNQIDVVSSQAMLTQNDTEDIHALLAGGPYRGPVLYAGFTVLFTRLPGGDGAYFAHFKDSTATGFRARVYAVTNGAAPGQFRLGLATGAGEPVLIQNDLHLGVRYQLVLRYHTGEPASALWLDPVGENSVHNRADATDTASATAITSFGLRQAQSSSTGMGTLLLDTLRVGSSFAEVLDGYDPHRAPPALSAIPDQSIPANTSTPAVPFVVQDGETAADALLLTAVSDHPELVATSGVVFSGGGSNRMVTITPTPGRQGAARITITVQDADGNTAVGTFQVAVGVPTLSPIPEQVTAQDTATPPIPFSIADAEFDSLLLGIVSTNETLLPMERIHFGGAGPSRTLTLDPTPGLTGLTEITLFVSDGFNTVSNRFRLTVYPRRGLLLSDDFNYADGSIVTNSQFTWHTYGASAGDTGQTQVIEGRLMLQSNQSEDLQAALSQGPYAPTNSWVLYASFALTCSSRPGGSGDYFAHFRGGTSGSGARVFVRATGAAAGKYRLGLANNDSSATAILPFDLELNTTQIVVVRYDTATGQSVLWLNPATEREPLLRAQDPPGLFAVSSYAFRQASAIGNLVIDGLRVGTSFSDVVPTVYSLTFRKVERGEAELSWPAAARQAGYFLQGSDSLTASEWNDFGDIEPTGGEIKFRFTPRAEAQFFRLAR